MAKRRLEGPAVQIRLGSPTLRGDWLRFEIVVPRRLVYKLEMERFAYMICH